MQFICDAGEFTWFRIETTGEAALESAAMNHKVEKYFHEAHDKAAESHTPPAGARYVESSIGRKDHILKTMPIFLTLRDKDGTALVTGMLPPVGKSETTFHPILVGPANADPYPKHAAAIRTLAKHYGLKLDPARCFPYRRS